MHLAHRFVRLLICLLVLATVALLAPRPVSAATPGLPSGISARAAAGSGVPGVPMPFRPSRGFRLAPSDAEQKAQARKRRKTKRKSK